MESTDDFSLDLETTVPTDLSISPDDTSEYAINEERKKRISRQLYEKKQLQHDYQVCKIELSQKSLLLDNLKAEYMNKVEELEEKLSESQHQRQVLQTRLQSELKIQQTESKRRQDAVQTELDSIMKRQQQLEATNRRLQEKAVDIKQSLRDLELTEGQYHELHAQPETELSLKDFVAMKLYETVKPWKLESVELKSRLRSVSDELRRCQTELDKYKDAYSEEQRQHSDLQNKFSRQGNQLAEVKQQVKVADYKVENFDRIKKERDEFDSELTDLKKRLAYLETAHETVTSERDDLRLEANSNKQTIQLLQQDKDYFSKQVSDLHNKLLYNEEKVVQLHEQLERAKDSREELYDKYVASRDQYRSEYETRLKEELEQIRVRTNAEIDRLKSSTKEMYERENRNLREARDMAYSEKDRAQQTEKEALGKYEQLMQDFRHLQASTDNQMSELRNEVKLRAFEAERSQIVYEESTRTLKECQLENEKLSMKLEVLLKEHFTMQTSLERRTAELDTLLAEKNVKLESYEKLEQELDNVVLQAAEVDDEEDAEKVLFSYGYGANVPTNAKRRLKQSVHLAKRVLTLERTNTTLKKELDIEKTRNVQLATEVKNTNNILDASQQPYHYLVESVRVRDTQISKQKEHIIRLEDDLRRVEKERTGLAKSKNQLSADLERLLYQKEEMSVMKEVVLNLSQRRIQPDNIKPHGSRVTDRDPFKHLSKSARSPRSKSPAAKTVVHDPRNFADLEFEDNIHKPEPTHFTATDTPRWYKQVQAKAKIAKSKYNDRQSSVVT